jgi:pimeloyl-ACP methyl ester carboxylesterase
MRTVSLLLGLVALCPAAAPAGDPPCDLKVKTADGMTLEADWYPGGEGMPGVVGLHMDSADRTSWKALAAERPAGFHFLALDLRGYGKSRMQGRVDLSDRVRKKDPTLFGAMWQDAMAGVKFLREEAKCDPKRIGLAGASMGCSVAIDCAVRDGRIAGVVALTPGKGCPGIPTMDHVKAWGDAPLLLVSSEEEADLGARPIAAELKGKRGVELRIVPGTKVQGTRMFGKVAGIEGRLANWLAAALGGEFLDGVVDACEEERTPMHGIAGSVDKTTGEFPMYGFRVGVDARGVNLSGEAPEGKGFPPGFELQVADGDSPGDAPPAGAMRLRGEASAEGSLIHAWLDTWKDGKWSEQALGDIAGAAILKERILEARIPWTTFKVKPGPAVWLRLRMAGQDMPVINGPRGMKVPE